MRGDLEIGQFEGVQMVREVAFSRTKGREGVPFYIILGKRKY
jgi:hypothetical protein